MADISIKTAGNWSRLFVNGQALKIAALRSGVSNQGMAQFVGGETVSRASDRSALKRMIQDLAPNQSGIIAILIGLLLPAVQKVREAASRSRVVQQRLKLLQGAGFKPVARYSIENAWPSRF